MNLSVAFVSSLSPGDIGLWSIEMSLSNHSNNCPTLYSLLDYAHFVPRLTSTNSINGGTNRKTFHVSFGLVSSFIHYDLC